MNGKELNHALATSCPVVLKSKRHGTYRYAYVSAITKTKGKDGNFVFSATVEDYSGKSSAQCDPAELYFYNPADMPSEDAPQIYGVFQNVYMSCEEHEKLVAQYGKKQAEDLIDNLSAKMRSKGYKFNDHYATILAWAIRDGVEPKKEKSYDLDDFFEAALARAEAETPD